MTSDRKGRRRIVIVGGDAAGLELAARLGNARSRHRNVVDVTLVDRNLSHFWKPMLHTLAAGTERSSNRKTSFLAGAKANRCRFGTAKWMLDDIDRLINPRVQLD